jgi:two-component system chemotaxis response regulator CheY
MKAPVQRKILLVDDDSFVRSTIRSMLQIGGQFEVIPARDGQSALELFDSFKPELVLCDIGMTPMNGIELVERIRGHADPVLRDVPIIMLTANSKEATIVKTATFGIAGYILKPVSATQLRSRIEAVLNK